MPAGRQHGKRGPSQQRGPKQRRSLSHIGGPVELWGDNPVEREALLASLDVDAGDDGAAARAHVHGFHSYPARMHPDTARRLVERLSSAGGVVLDPFCGSGTVLVEGLLAGRGVVGVDANPLAVELAWLKTLGTTAAERAELVESARAVVNSADDRRKRRAGATRRYGSEDVALFDPHVLLELDGLVTALRAIDVAWPRRALALVLSSILVKVSRQPGDTSRARGERRLASGFTLDLFQRKTTELAARLAEFQSLLPAPPLPARPLLPASAHDPTHNPARDPAPAPASDPARVRDPAPAPAPHRSASRAPPKLESPVVHLGDARQLQGVGGGSIDLVVTSPPYPGTYDYLAHHAARLRWLEFDAERFAEIELGARRHLERLSYGAALERFKADLGACLSSMSRVLTTSGRIVLILADSVIQGRAVQTDRLVRELAARAGLEVTAVGSQKRPHFNEASARAFARVPRREHAIVCRRANHR